jgi:hypothetical protein
MIPGITSANFNEPQSNDPTSAPAIQIPQGAQQSDTVQPQPSARAGSLAQALANRKKKGIGPTMKPPSSLAAAISRAKRARQGGDKYG